MDIVLHITHREAWEQARASGAYAGDTLATEHFIHCSTPAQVVRVADLRFRAQQGLVLLCIDPGKVKPPLRYELGEDGDHYPHIYSLLNADAVVDVLSFDPRENGRFVLPSQLKAPS